jgi:hypothetical protein
MKTVMNDSANGEILAAGATWLGIWPSKVWP